MSEKETWDRRTALMISTGIHAAILLSFFLMVAWRAPNPPAPEYGIEINFGVDEQGSGDIQTQDPIIKGEEKPIEQVEEKPSEPTPETIEKPTEVTPSTDESAVHVEDKKVTPPPPKVEKKNEVKPPVPIQEVVKNDTKPKAEYVPEGKADGTTDGKGKSQGNDVGKVGDKGSPKGIVDPNAVYGGGGGGVGFSLSMSGWEWASPLHPPKIGDNETGRVIFEIECDETGEITAIKTIERGGLSAETEGFLKAEIRKNSLNRTSSGILPERSKGQVIFVIKAK